MAIDNIFYVNTASISVLLATGSLLGTASYAGTASVLLGSVSQATTATQSLYATNSLFASSSAFATQSLFSSQSLNATQSLTASYFKITPAIKSGKVSASLFSGSPLTASIVFTSAYPNTNYSVNICGGDARSWTVENLSSSAFIISSNSTQPLTDYVYWQSMFMGESL